MFWNKTLHDRSKNIASFAPKRTFFQLHLPVFSSFSVDESLFSVYFKCKDFAIPFITSKKALFSFVLFRCVLRESETSDSQAIGKTKCHFVKNSWKQIHFLYD